MLRQKYTQAEIAAELNVAESTISRDVKLCRAEWHRTRGGNITEERLAYLAELDYLERVAWQRFWESVKDREVSATEQTVYGVETNKPAKKKASIRRERRDGSVKWLDLILRCKQERAKVLALYLPPEGGWPPLPGGTVESVDVRYNFRAMSADELLEAAAEIEREGRELVEEARRITAGAAAPLVDNADGGVDSQLCPPGDD
jgi:hypothetical protein